MNDITNIEKLFNIKKVGYASEKTTEGTHMIIPMADDPQAYISLCFDNEGSLLSGSEGEFNF